MSDDPRPASPDTASVSLGYEADDHLGSLKPPIYETSTFVFKTAEEGKRFFEVAYGLDEAREGEEFGYIYSRLDNPNLRVAEARLAVWEDADDALVFNSGMAAMDLVLRKLPLKNGAVIARFITEMADVLEEMNDHEDLGVFRDELTTAIHQGTRRHLDLAGRALGSRGD